MGRAMNHSSNATRELLLSGDDKAYREGALVGKFLPAHVGHLHLIRFACNLCDHVTVVVDCVPGEWPSAEFRAAAMRADLHGLPVTVVALAEPTPQAPPGDPAGDKVFWDTWHDLMVGACNGVPDALVCSMDYGMDFAKAIGCEFVPIDIERDALPMSATMIRPDPWARWDMMLPNARLPYLARVALEGAESTGKSTIGVKIAREFGYGYAPEWAKCHVEQRLRQGREFEEPDLLRIARGQIASERSLEIVARRALLCDSSLLSTMAWGQLLYGRIDPQIERMFEAEETRAPRQRWFFTPDTPWVSSEHRQVARDAGSDSTRQRFMGLLLNEADRWGVPYEMVHGNFAEKEQTARWLATRLGPPNQPQITHEPAPIEPMAMTR